MVRPRLGANGNPAALPSERAPQVSAALLNHRMAEYREAVGLDPVLDFHSLRRSYVTHLIEVGSAGTFRARSELGAAMSGLFVEAALSETPTTYARNRLSGRGANDHRPQRSGADASHAHQRGALPTRQRAGRGRRLKRAVDYMRGREVLSSQPRGRRRTIG